MTQIIQAAVAGAALGAIIPGALTGMIGWPGKEYLWTVQVVCGLILVAGFIALEIRQQRRQGP